MNNTPLKVLADGTQIPSEDPRTDHVAVLFPDGWMVAVAPLTAPEGEEFDNADLADKAASDVRLFDHADWGSAPLDEVWLRHILKHDRHSPAVDQNLFPNFPSGWFWTGTGCSWSKDPQTGVAASAWFVSSDGGGVYSNPRDYSGFGLAARRVGQ